MVLQSHSSGQEEVVSGLREATAQLKAGKASEKTAAGHSHGRRLPSRGCCVNTLAPGSARIYLHASAGRGGEGGSEPSPRLSGLARVEQQFLQYPTEAEQAQGPAGGCSTAACPE